MWTFLNSQFISSLIGAGIGAFAAVYCTRTTLQESATQLQKKFELEQKAKLHQTLKGLLAELESNMNLLKDSNNVALLLSNSAWQQSQGILLSKNADVFAECVQAYAIIGRIMSSVQLRINGQGGNGSYYSHRDEIDGISKAKVALESMIDGLEK